MISFKKLRSYIVAKDHHQKPYQDLNNYVQDVVWGVKTVSRTLPGKRKCLVRALCGKYLLDRRYIPVQLVVGVKKDSNNFLDAHAWLEYEKKVILGEVEDVEFTPLPAIK